MKLPGLIDLSFILILASNLKGSEGQNWEINVTRHINAILGSNVTIPCMFTCPDKDCKEIKQVYWKNLENSEFNTFDNDQRAFVFHPNITFVLEKYRGKTILTGNINKKECSLMIRNITGHVENIYVRVIASSNNYSFNQRQSLVSIFVSGTPVTLNFSDTTNTSRTTFEIPTTGPTMEPSGQMYTSIFVPVTALLIIIFVIGVVGYIKHKRSETFTREESGYYANFSRASSNEPKRETSLQKHDNKKFPEPKAIDEPAYLKTIEDPVYINLEAPPCEMDQNMDQSIYANVDYSK